MKYVVDTNVLIAANGRDTHAPHETCLAAAQFLMELMNNGDVLLEDSLDLIFTEYKNYMQFSGQPGLGDAFFRWYVNRRWRAGEVESVQLDARRSLISYIPESLHSFDPSDHKWIAVHIEGRGDLIVNATDSDWAESRFALEANNIQVRELSE